MEVRSATTSLQTLAEALPRELAVTGLELGKDGSHLIIWQHGPTSLEARPEHVARYGAGKSLVMRHESAAQLCRLALQTDTFITPKRHPDMLVPFRGPGVDGSERGRRAERVGSLAA